MCQTTRTIDSRMVRGSRLLGKSVWLLMHCEDWRENRDSARPGQCYIVPNERMVVEI